MSAKKGIQPSDNLLDDEDFEYEKTLAEQAKAAREREEELYLQHLEEQKQREKQREKEREERLKRERLELMKLKSGVISDEEATIKEEHTEKTQLHGKAWVANFVYHYKFMIIFVVFLIIVTTFIIIDTVRREKADLTVVMIANNGLQTRQEELEEFFEKYTPDFDGNGYVHVDVVICPQGPDTSQVLGQDPNNTKLIAQMQEGKAVLPCSEKNGPDKQEIVLATIPSYVDEDGMSWNFGFLAEELRFENMPNDIHLSMRIPVKTLGDTKKTMQENYDKSLEVFGNMLEDLTKRAEETGDKGLETEPIKYDENSSESSDESSKAK